MAEQLADAGYDVGTTIRHCGNPTCSNSFDIAAHLAGEVNAGRWMRNRLVYVLCPGCSTGAHVPDWAPVDTKALAWCSCGWRGEPARTIGAAIDQWGEHVRTEHTGKG